MKWSRVRSAFSQAALQAFVLLSVLAFWEFAVWAFEISKIVIPAPTDIAVSLYRSLASTSFYRHLWVTMFEILVGFGVGAGAGLLLGFLIGIFPILDRVLYPYVVAFETIPKVAIAPIIVIWFGYGPASKVVITATIAFFPLIANTITGLRSAPSAQIEMMVAHTANRWQVFRAVRLPSALPYVFAGLNIAIVLSVIGAIVGEFVGAKEGLGFLIMQRNFQFDMAGTFAIIITLSVIGVTLHRIVLAIQKRTVFWIDTSRDQVAGP